YHLGRPGQLQVERTGGAFQARPMLLPGKQHAVVGAPHLINCVAVKKAAVERADRRLVRRVQPAVGIGLDKGGCHRPHSTPPPAALPKEKTLPVQNRERLEENQSNDQPRAFTSPSSFLMFCTLGTEMPSSLAIWAPVLPDDTASFTCCFISGVIFARLRFLPPLAAGALDFLAAGRRPRRLREPLASFRARINGCSES